MEDCIFCKIAKKEIPLELIYEDEDLIAFLDANPRGKGHSLIIPKIHFKDIFDIPEEVASKIMPLAKKISIALKKAVNPDGINIVQNNGASAGQVVFHSHTHVVPRFDGDGRDVFALPIYEYAEGEKEALIEELRANL